MGKWAGLALLAPGVPRAALLVAALRASLLDLPVGRRSSTPGSLRVVWGPGGGGAVPPGRARYGFHGLGANPHTMNRRGRSHTGHFALF